MKHGLKQILCMALVCALTLSVNRATSAELTDVQAKLVIIHSFMSQYVKWPGSQSLENLSEIYVCSIGEDALTKKLSLLTKASTDSLKVKVMSLSGVTSPAHCHVLYIAESEKLTAKSILAKIGKRSVLTISEIKNFTEEGGMVGLVTEVKRHGNFEKTYVRYALNAKALSKAGLSVEPDALELATKVVE